MAVILDPNDPNNQGMATGGSVLAGNSGAKSAGPTAAGSGWTNLQTYLGANQGNGAGVANTIVEEGQKAFDVNASNASKASDAWGDSGVSAVNKNDPTSQVTAASQVVNAKGSDYGQTAANASGLQYGGPKNASEIQGMDGLQKAYKNADATADNFTQYGTQSATLKDKYKYSGGSAALDTLIGRGDAGTLISDWQARSKAGIRSGDQYTGIAKNTGRINDAANNAQRGLSDAQAQLGRDVAGRQKSDAEEAARQAEAKKLAEQQAQAAEAARVENERVVSGIGSGVKDNGVNTVGNISKGLNPTQQIIDQSKSAIAAAANSPSNVIKATGEAISKPSIENTGELLKAFVNPTKIKKPKWKL